ncbi:MAG: zeta toxin family protein [Legionellaceae bacterium]|nr:zeta toxin family protein [Legionellaceae bacterium]
MIVIFISGASGCGKTILSNLLKSHFEKLEKTCEILHLDDYFKEIPENRDLVDYKTTTDFTQLNLRDLSLLASQILALNNGKEIVKPEYSFKTCKRTTIKKVFPAQFLIVEGTFILHFANIMPEFKNVFKTKLSQIGVYIKQSHYEETIARRIMRDLKERGQTKESMAHLDHLYLRPAYINIIEPSGRTADIQIINDHQNDLNNAIKDIIDFITNK